MTFPTFTVEFSPTTGPFDTPTWVSLSAGGPHGNRVFSADWTDGKQADLEQFPPGEATIVLKNADRLFDPEHAAGTYFGELNPRVPFRIRATHSAVTYDLFYGFVEDGWAQTYHPPEGSTCTVKLIDMLGVLAGYTLPSVLETEILADGPIGYWPLDEQGGAVARGDDGTPDGEYTPGTTSLSATQETETGLAWRGIAFDGEHGVEVEDGTAVPPSRPWVMTALMLPSSDPDPGGQTVYAAGLGNPVGQMTLASAVDTDGLWNVYGAAIDGTANNLGVGAQEPQTGFVRHVALRAPAAGAVKVYVDGVDVTTSNSTYSTTSVITPGTTLATVKIVGEVASGLQGFLAQVAVFDSDIGATRIADHATAALSSLTGLRSDEQIQWALDTVGVPASLYDLDQGRSIMGPADPAGRDVVEFMREITATEQGGLFVNHADGGKLKFRQRYASFQDTRSTVAQAAFSDDPAASWSAVARVEPGTLQVEPNGVSTVINQATVSWRGGSETVDESVGSPYGPRGVSITTQSATPAVARGVARWIIALNDVPRAKIRSLGVDPAAAQTAFPVALATRIGDRATFRSHPQATGSATTKNLEVLGRHHTVQGKQWDVDFYLTAAPNSTSGGVTLFTLGVSQLGGTHILAY